MNEQVNNLMNARGKEGRKEHMSRKTNKSMVRESIHD